MEALATEVQVSRISVSQIVAGSNPRRHFDEQEMLDLELSIEAQGVIQPIAVRPVKDKYEIVAGERRWRAAKKVFGDAYEIPVIVREMTDEEAAAASANENMIRAAMSPAEESEVAAKILAQHKGDYNEAAKRLGWTRSVLEKRLSLMQCSQNVRDALSKRQIKLEFAELLATATKERQDEVLVKLLALPALPPIQDFKAQIQRISKMLSAAIFDKTECAGCKFNSSNQSQLFAEAIDQGYCTNSPCYEQKTEVELNARVDGLKDEFPTVKLVRPGMNFIQIKLVSDGPTGVGEAQALACKSCQNFGGAVSALPGSEGKVYKGLCFDTDCNSTKVAERIKAEKAQLAEETKSDKSATYDKTGKVVEIKSAVKSEPKVSVTDTARVKEYRLKEWRKALKSELMSNEEKNKIVLLAIGICGLGKHINKGNLTKALNKLTGSDVGTTTFHHFLQVANILSEADDKAKATLHLALAASIEADVEETDLCLILKFLQVDMAKHWKLNKDYLETMTKSEIDLIAEEIGLKAFIGEAYAKLMNGKKDEIVTALLNVEGFDYQGKIPKVMLY